MTEPRRVATPQRGKHDVLNDKRLTAFGAEAVDLQFPHSDPVAEIAVAAAYANARRDTDALAAVAANHAAGPVGIHFAAAPIAAQHNCARLRRWHGRPARVGTKRIRGPRGGGPIGSDAPIRVLLGLRK